MSSNKWLCAIGVALLIHQSSLAGPLSSYAQALATTNDVLIYAGEGYGDESLLLAKVQQLQAPEGAANQGPLNELAGSLKPLVSNGPSPDEGLSWAAAADIAEPVRALVSAAETNGAVDQPLLLEFLLTHYLYRSYFGVFEKAPEARGSLIALDESGLMVLLEDRFPTAGTPVSARRRCVQRAIENLTGVATKVRLTPLTFYKCTRSLTEQPLQ
jgi:hypothetical protein